jgi:hypothetical protein
MPAHDRTGKWIGILAIAVPVLWAVLSFAISIHTEIVLLKVSVERLQDEKDQLMQAVMNLEEPSPKKHK